ncbi:MAG: Ig-like domain-containing protein [Desulfobacterales bacterium]|nr:Ig-like domain-containing protein [Desulfobacterales bacterium]
MKFKCTGIAILIFFMAFLSVGCGSSGSGSEPGSTTDTSDTNGTGITANTIDLRVSNPSVPADGYSTIMITATVKSATNQAVPDVDVMFETERGTIISPITTDSSGQAVSELISDQYNDLEVKITAKVNSIQKSTTIAFIGINLSLEADPDNLLAGETPSTITATLKDAAGNPMPDAIIEFSIVDGNGSGVLDESSQETDVFGEADVKLNSSQSSTVKVTAIGSGKDADQPVQVIFTRYLFTLKAYKQGTNPADDINTIRVGESANIEAKLIEAISGGVDGEEVVFNTSLGTLNSMKESTNISGLTSTTLKAGTQAGVATIDANVTIASNSPSTELSASTQVVVVGGDAMKIVLSSDPSVISTETGVATITARVYDTNDQPAVDQDIWFRITKGPGSSEYLSNAVKTTDNLGIATSELHAGFLSSTHEGVVIEANTKSNFTGSSGLTSLTIAGPVKNIGVGIDLHELIPDGGHLTVDVSALATDANGNPVPDGTSVNFSVDAIEFDEDRDYDGIIECWNTDGDSIICSYYYTAGLTPKPAPGLGKTWFTDDVNLDGTFDTMATSEDINGNGIIDMGEDINGNGVIDPVNSCIVNGNIGTVNGVASSTLYYLQSHAANIKIRLTAEAGGVSNFYETVLLCTKEMVEDLGTCGLGY